MNLALTLKQEEVSDSVVIRLKDLLEAINLCITTSGLPIKDVAFQCGYGEHPEQFSRMLNGTMHLPPRLIDKIMDICGNEIPLRWQNLKRGYGMHRLKSALELENENLRAALEQERHEKEVIKNFLKEVKL